MQKFHKGDLVHIAKDLGSSMSHFTADVDAIVIGSYSDQYGTPDSGGGYTIHIKDHGQHSWYYESQLTLIENNRIDLLGQWQKEEKAEDDLHSDLDWIFSHGPELLKGCNGASISKLASCLGVHNLWGSHGEGFVYYQNAMQCLAICAPFLEKNDRAGFEQFCKQYAKA